MIKKIKNFFPLLIFYGILVLVLILNFSQPVSASGNSNTTGGTVVNLTNPLTGTPEGIDPQELWGRIIFSFLEVIGMAALLMFIIGGFYLLTSSGNPEKVKKGIDTMKWAVLGLIGTMMAYLIIRYIIVAITTTAGGGGS